MTWHTVTEQSCFISVRGSFKQFPILCAEAAAASIVALTKTYVAQFDYNCESASEISLEAGDVVEVLDQRKSGWWLGRCRGKEGLFPASFVVEIDAEQSNEAAPPAANVPAEQTNTEGNVHLCLSIVSM